MESLFLEDYSGVLKADEAEVQKFIDQERRHRGRNKDRLKNLQRSTVPYKIPVGHVIFLPKFAVGLSHEVVKLQSPKFKPRLKSQMKKKKICFQLKLFQQDPKNLFMTLLSAISKEANIVR